MLEPRLLAVVVVFLWVVLALPPMAESGIGVNWGTISFHRLKPTTVVDLLKENKIQKVKLFEADSDVLKALMGSGIQVMVGIPNEMLPLLSSSTSAADFWVRQNVSAYMGKGGADIRFLLRWILYIQFFPTLCIGLLYWMGRDDRGKLSFILSLSLFNVHNSFVFQNPTFYLNNVLYFTLKV